VIVDIRTHAPSGSALRHDRLEALPQIALEDDQERVRMISKRELASPTDAMRNVVSGAGI